MTSGSGEIRLAGRADNDALLELFGAVPMEGDLILTSERAPDFFALYDMQDAGAECWIWEDGRGPEVMGSFLIRDGFVGGEETRVGYLGDLRARLSGRRALAVPKFYGEVFEDVRERRGCELFYTSVLASNRAALSALVRRRKERVLQPHYHPLEKFQAVQVQFVLPKRLRDHGFEVRTASAADLPAIKALLAEDHRRRIFGYRFDRGELEHRLKHWPGYSLEQTYLAFSGAKLVGVATAWDAAPVKRFRVLQYRRGMRWAKLGFNALAAVVRAPRLPQPGGVFRYVYLANVSIEGENPMIYRALLSRIYADLFRRGYHFITLYMAEDDPLRPALDGFITRALDFQLFAVTSGEVARKDFPPARSGFEIALA